MPNHFQLFYLLPYWIPINGSIIELEENDSFIIKVMISSERGEKRTLTGEHLYPYTYFILTITDKNEGENELSTFSGEPINRIHEFGLNFVNSIIESLRLETDMLHLHEISTTDLELVSKIIINGKTIPFITSPHKFIAENNRLITHVTFKLAWNKKDDTLNYKFFYDKARSDFVLGKNSDSIIGLQISFEGFIDELLNKFIETDLLPESRKKAIIESKFRHKIENHLAKFLNRDLHYEKNPFIKAWRKQIYLIRNKIVHDGQKAQTLHGRYALKTFLKVHNYLVKAANKSLNTKHFSEVEIGSVNLWNGQMDELKKLRQERILSNNIKGRIKLKFKSYYLRFSAYINYLYTIMKLKSHIIKNDV
ncbi:hypothetical protein CH372_17375 [Leptospira meyeri]|uniref:HEPN domain-containing protein n=1 Tax=Leptospira meyeri TaxID=29508 RepID=UPI000C2A8A3E|nr:HEPN domain-containing protein [Leptospira meyeri]PKA10853.1 hypothetical protein CH372_17375 [Leptospira meyeri]